MKQILDEKQLETHGSLICIYGMSGVGKTVSSLSYLPKPLDWIMCEPRDIKPSIEVAGVKVGKDLRVSVYENFMETIEYIQDPGNFKDIRSILYDGFSYMMNVELPDEMIMADDNKKKLREVTKYGMPDRGHVNRAVFRILKCCGRLTTHGKTVVISCLETSNPKWDRELYAAPLLSGKEVPESFPGYFDYIGHLSSQVNKDGKVVYPPIIDLTEGGDFLAKFTGAGDKRRGPVDKFLQKFNQVKATKTKN